MKRKILIVDDNAMNRNTLINTLENDFEIIETDSGKEALTILHSQYKHISAVLIDIFMSEMDGYEVLENIRGNFLFSQIPIIMITCSDDENTRIKVLSLGANDFIQNPFNPHIVRHCLKNCIALRESASILNDVHEDKLTGLLNREAFFNSVEALIKEKDPGYYIFSCFDIDNFKLINDQYGSIDGDRILKRIGITVKSEMQKIGGIGGHISADNFALLFPEKEKDREFLRNILNNDSSPIERRTMVFSVGRYHITDVLFSASAIYDRAYLAKQSVKGRYDKHLAYFDETMLEKLIKKQQIISDMEMALYERQFEVWLQPQYNHVSGSLTGAEALVRWIHPIKGKISPNDFIPLFEKNGFIYELDKFVLEEACRYLHNWISEGLSPVPISVNISRYDIFREDLLNVICNLVKKYDVPIELLRLEITESAFSKSTSFIVNIVKQLIDIGFTIEIDDFGSGYSSLNTLKNVPAQIVKLDMRFLSDDCDGVEANRGGNILESVVRMAKWLGMSVIAEGVETKEQGDFLKSIGCSHVQGYLYAHPMPEDEYRSHFINAFKEYSLSTIETVENLDNNMFWNPNSIDSLIFNSYVGSACIYEFYDGHIELLRATDKYAKMLCGEQMTVDTLLGLDLMEYMDNHISAKTLKRIGESAKNNTEILGEFLFINLPGCCHETYVHSTMRVIARAENRYLIYCISENITTQHILEKKQRSITRQLQVIMDNINCGITAMTGRGNNVNFLLANDRFFQLLGYTAEQYHEEIGKNSISIIYKDDLNYANQIIDSVYSTGIPSSMEYRALKRDGSVIWIRSFLSVTRFEDTDELVQLCTYTDITSEKNSTMALLDNLPCGLGICVISNNDAYMSFLNKRYLEYFSNHKKKNYSGSVYDVIHPDDRTMLHNAMIPALSRSGEGSCVVRILDNPGEYISFRVTGVAMNTNGDKNSIYVTFVPITDEKLSFNEMIPVVLEKVMESSSDFSFVKDINLKYICCSKTFANMVGLNDEKEVVGKVDYDLFEKKFADEYNKNDKLLLKGCPSIIDTIEKIPGPFGGIAYSKTSKYLLYNSLGNIIGIYGLGRDITKLRELERREKFLLNNFLGGIAVYKVKLTGSSDITLKFVNEEFCNLIGFTENDLQHFNVNMFKTCLSRKNIKELGARMHSLMYDCTPIDYIFKYKYNSGETKKINIKAIQGECNGVYITINVILLEVKKQS